MLEASFNSISSLCKAFRDRGCKQLLVKPLSTNQDNEKNQIYLAGDSSLLTYWPGEFTFEDSTSSSISKRHSSPGSIVQKLAMKFYWLWPDGEAHHAPSTKAIFYFQYPELRLSGFLRGCNRAPQALRRDKMDEYGRRALVVGFHDETVFGAVISDVDGPGLIDSLLDFAPFTNVIHSGSKSRSTVLRQIPFDGDSSTKNLDDLIAELRTLSSKWHKAQTLKTLEGPPIFVKNRQGSGWTLESLLGIPQNSRAEADKDGYEFKALPRTGPVTITTTEPDFGYRKEHGLTKFLLEYGWPGADNDGSHRFNGVHKTNFVNEKSNARVEVSHWDREAGKPDGTGTPEIAIVHEPSGVVLAGWNMNTLANKWSKKHSGAIYVDYRRFPKKGPLASHYVYGPIAHCGQGTSVNLLIASLARGEVFFDPGDRVLSDGKEKKRMQWRVNGLVRNPAPETLRNLYNGWEPIEISNDLLPPDPVD